MQINKCGPPLEKVPPGNMEGCENLTYKKTLSLRTRNSNFATSI